MVKMVVIVDKLRYGDKDYKKGDVVEMPVKVAQDYLYALAVKPEKKEKTASRPGRGGFAQTGV